MEEHTKRRSGYRHIRKEERSEIAILFRKGYGARDIATALNRSHTSIGREILKNSTNGIYDPRKAHAKARVRRTQSKYQGMKIARNHILKEYVHEKLLSGWTPEQIAGRLKWIDTHKPYVSSRAIYKFLYSAMSEGLWIHLKSARYHPRKRRTSHVAREIIKHRIFIERRPRSVNARKTFGHFEVDRIESNKTSRAGLLVAQERTSRYYVAVKTATRKPAENKTAICAALANIVQIKSLTYDNDIAFARHEEVNDALSSKSFFCHPYHSWEKGGIEHANKLMREYIPKGSDIDTYSHAYIGFALYLLNNRPRECLRFKTSSEVMRENHMFKVEKRETKNTTAGGALEGSA